MRADEIQYIADCLLIDRLAQMDAALEKRADLGEMARNGLSGAAQAISSFVRDNADFSSPAATGISLLKILGPAVLFRVNIFVGMAFSAAAKLWGVNIPSIWDSLINPIKGKIEQGIQIHPDEIKPQLSSDAFADIRTIIRNGELLKIAQYGRTQSAGGNWLVPPKNAPLIYKMFGFLGPNKSKNIVTGFLMWLLKTALVSAGLMAVSGGLANIISPGHATKQQEQTAPQQQLPNQNYNPEGLLNVNSPSSKHIALQPSGKGEQFHANDANTAWLVPLNGDVRNTLLDWATTVYPELEGQENNIAATPSFNRMANILEDNINEKSPNYLMVPAGYNKIIDIVNTFAGDIKKEPNNAIS